MCGIVGLTSNSANESELSALVKAMNASLTHRGPDGEGYLLDRGVALGHRRLSIIDLAGGDQPIYNEDGSVGIVFNGEIYNYKELREDLIARGHTLSTHSDTEVIVHLYEERGPECLEALNGMFAFAVWDKKRRVLFLARDRLGEKPLYYARHKGRFMFGSELKAIMPQIADREIDLDALDDYLAYGYVPAPRTIWKNVYKLPAAHYMIVDGDRTEIKRYWTVRFTEQGGFDEASAMDALRELIDDSIKLRLRSDVPVGAFLSGGIDSSLVVALASRHSQNLSTFSVGFSEKDYDELQYARHVAEKFGTNHHETMLTEIDPTLFDAIVNHFDEPFADPSAIPTWYVTREAARHLKVVLSGDGADELFCGYTRYNRSAGEQLAHALPTAMRAAIFSGMANQLPDSLPGKGWLRRAAASGQVHWQRTIGEFDSTERCRLWRPEYRRHVDRSAALLAPWFESAELDLTSRRMLADQNTYLPDDILVKVDRNAMWHSLETRVPYLDHRLVEFANSLPLSFKFHNGVQKYPLKRLLGDYVSQEFLNRRKTGFGMPIKHWLRQEFYEYSRELLLSSSTRCSRFFEPGQLERLVSENKLGRRDLSRRIWLIMWFEQWCRIWSI